MEEGVRVVRIEKPSVWERLMTIGWIAATGAPLLYIAVVDDTTENVVLGALVVLILCSSIFMISAYSAIVSVTRGLIQVNEDVTGMAREPRNQSK